MFLLLFNFRQFGKNAPRKKLLSLHLKIAALFKIRFLLSIFFACIIYGKLTAQINYAEEKWQLGLNFGASYFGGDLTDNKNKIWNNTPFNSYYYEDRKLMLGLTFGKEISPSAEAALQFLYGSVQGTKESVNMYFNANVIETNLHLKLNLLNLIFGSNTKRRFDIYTITGIGFAYISSHSHFIRDDSISYGPRYYPNSYSGTGLLFPLGMGLRYDIGKHFRMGLESSYRILLNDQLDALSYNQKAVEGYGFIALSMTYKFDFPRIFFKKRGRNSFVATKKDVKLNQYKSMQTNGNVTPNKFYKSHNSGQNIYRGKRNKGLRNYINR